MVKGEAVVFPRSNTPVVRILARRNLAPASFTSDCFELPGELPAYVEPDAKCRNQLSGPEARDYYPEAHRRLREEGTVVLEYGVIPDSDLLQDVRVLKSSGFELLDTAALRLAGATRSSGGCPNLRYRSNVRFRVNG
jgi:TonB family protein